MSKIHFWTPDHTEQFWRRTRCPSILCGRTARLTDGTDNLQPVLPSYTIHKGYGFWLRTTPYFQGCSTRSGILSRLPGDADLPRPRSWRPSSTKSAPTAAPKRPFIENPHGMDQPDNHPTGCA